PTCKVNGVETLQWVTRASARGRDHAGIAGEVPIVCVHLFVPVVTGPHFDKASCRRRSCMRSFSERGVPLEEHSPSTPVDASPDWDNIRAFLALTRHGSFRSAAESLGISTNALRRRIEDLECSLGTTLVTRHVDGVRTTAEGADILTAALKMEEAAFSLVRARDQTMPEISGTVRIAVTEAFGTFWLGPRLIDFQRAHPTLTIDLNCAMHSADVLRLEADLSVQLTRPTNPDVKHVRLGRIHTMPSASPGYLAIYGIPKSIEEMRN